VHGVLLWLVTFHPRTLHVGYRRVIPRVSQHPARVLRLSQAPARSQISRQYSKYKENKTSSANYIPYTGNKLTKTLRKSTPLTTLCKTRSNTNKNNRRDHTEFADVRAGFAQHGQRMWRGAVRFDSGHPRFAEGERTDFRRVRADSSTFFPTHCSRAYEKKDNVNVHIRKADSLRIRTMW
jgi:hypothetical protein